jgi:hypothetical protein
MDKLARNQIGYQTPGLQIDEDVQLQQKVELLERRVEALENNDGNYQQYLKMKQKFEGTR